MKGGTERNISLEILEELGSREVLCDVWDNGTIIRMEAKVTKWGFILLSKILIISHYSHILGLP